MSPDFAPIGWRALFGSGLADLRFITELSLPLPEPLRRLPRTVLEVRPLPDDDQRARAGDDQREPDAPPARWLVLLGACAPAPRSDTRLAFGFCNDEAECDQLRRQGVLVFESEITQQGSQLRLRLDRLLSRGAAASGPAELTILGLDPFGPPAPANARAARPAPARSHDLSYLRCLSVPDAARPDAELNLLDIAVAVTLHQRPAAPMAVQLRLGQDEPIHVPAQAAWITGWPPMFAEPAVARSSAPADLPSPPPAARRAPRSAVLPIPPCYRFEQVEVIGFRLNLAELGLPPAAVRQLLPALLAPLNRPLDDAQDFQYAAATGTLLLELLRYPVMRLGDEADGRYQCQHELLVRLLTGRVDDGTAQAHDPAYHVPAIFVDNVWSKVLGRELPGLDKRLAQFCTRSGEALACDGRDAAGQLVPLPSVHSIRLQRSPIGGDTGPAPRSELLGFDGLEALAASRLWSALQQDLLLDGLKFAGWAWRPADFDQKTFRRAFARQILRGHLQGFRSVQVTEPRPPLHSGLIGARFEFEQLRVGSTDATVRLHFASPDGAPQAWQALVGALQAHDADSVTLLADDCYRLRCNMRLTVDDGLAW